MNTALDVTDATFQTAVIDDDGTVLVDFWAPWCGPCRAISPILDAIASEHPTIRLVKVNIDENPEVAETYGITSIPAMKVFRGGLVVKSIIGAKPKPALLHDLADFLS